MLEQDKISINDAAGRLTAGVIVLGFATAVVNKFWKEGKEKAHKERQFQVSAKQNNQSNYIPN